MRDKPVQQWHETRLQELGNPRLWRVQRKTTVRRVGCRVCKGTILKHTAAMFAETVQPKRDAMPGFMHIACYQAHVVP